MTTRRKTYSQLRKRPMLNAKRLTVRNKKALRIKVKNEYFKAGAHYTIDNLSEIFNIIELINIRLGKNTTDRTSE